MFHGNITLIISEQPVQAQLACWGWGGGYKHFLHACLSLQCYFALTTERYQRYGNVPTSYTPPNSWQRQTSDSFKGNTARCRQGARQPDFATRAGGLFVNTSCRIIYYTSILYYTNSCLLRVGGRKDLQSETDD